MTGLKKKFIIDLKHTTGNVEVKGWVHQKRDVGKLVFIVLRDRTGTIQTIFKDLGEEVMNFVHQISLEDIVKVNGLIQEKTNRDGTKDFELKAASVEIISKGNNPVILPAHIDETTEKTRLKYRYIELRTKEKQDILVLRHNVIREVTAYLDRKKFVNVPTPILSKATPEGSRDFLIASREYEDKYYALPQSPQLYKQILMSSGVERYYQISPSFRDEDARADRHQEFYEIDLEGSYFSSLEIRLLVTGLLRTIFKKYVKNAEISFTKLTYAKAINSYGTDKPDLRFDMKIMPLARQLQFYMSTRSRHLKENKNLLQDYSTYLMEDLGNKNIEVKGEILPHSLVKNAKSIFIESPDFQNNKEAYLESILSRVELLLKQHGLRTSVSLISLDDKAEKVIHRTYDFDYNMLYKRGEASKFWHWKDGAIDGKKNGFILVINKPHRAKDNWKVMSILGLFRYHWGRDYLVSKKDNNVFKFAWITDWPLFEKEKDTGSLTSVHHPFTKPDLRKLPNPLNYRNALKAKSTSYDIVCNGYELGSGSERLVDSKLQKEIFKILKINEEEMREKFGFFIDAMNSGTPPHAGIGLGLERILMVMVGTHNIRDVIPFPKTADGFDLMSNSPSSL